MNAILAVILTALAGYVDAIGYRELGGTFISFMSGNSTQLGTDLAAGEWAKVGKVAAVIALFLVGVMAGHALRQLAPRRRQGAVLALVTLLLTAAAALHGAGMAAPAIGAAGLAMGAVNATFEKNGEVSVGVTFVSSTLVKLGDHLAAALGGGPAFGWVKPLGRWAAFVAGALAGGLMWRAAGFDAVWAAAGTAALCTLAARG